MKKIYRGKPAWLVMYGVASLVVQQLLPSGAMAATKDWTGNTDSSLSSAGNWAGFTAPVSGDTLSFTGIGGTITNSYPANTQFNGFVFQTGIATSFIIGTTGSNVINLGGDITNSSLIANTINNPLALTAGRTVNVASQYSAGLSLGGVLSETGGTGFGLTKAGAGLLTLSGANTFTGSVTINGGTVAIGSDSTAAINPLGNGASGAATLTLDGGALRSTATLQMSTNRGVALGSSGGTIDVVTGTLTYNGVITGSGNAFTKTNSGTLTLGGVNTYTGNTTVNQGTLKLDFTQLSGTTSNIISSSSTLVLGGVATTLGNGAATTTTSSAAGDTLNMTSKSAANSSQTFNGLTLNAGNSVISTTQTASGNNLLALGAITHNAGGLINFSFAGSLSATNAIMTSTGNSNGILGGWATYGPIGTTGLGYAANNGLGSIIAYTGYTPIATAGTIASSAGTNVQVQSSGAVAITVAGAGTTTDISTFSLSSAATGATTITNNATGILRLGATGGLLVGSTGGTLIVTGGTLTAGGAANTAGEISLISNNTTNGNTAITINSVIADNGTGAVSVSIGGTQGGNGSVVNLSGLNSYTGGTTITAGRVSATNGSAFGTGTVTILTGAQAFLSAGSYANNFSLSGMGTSIASSSAGGYDTPGALRLAGSTTLGGTITLLSDAALNSRNTSTNVISGKVTGNYNFVLTGNGAGGGNISLSNTSNDFGGNLVIDQKQLILGFSNVVPNGTGKGNVVLANTANSIFDLNGNNETINGLISAGSNPFVQNNVSSTASTLTIGDADAGGSFTGTIRDNSGTGGTVALIKIGTGMESFSASNTFSGGLTIKGGTIFNNGNANTLGSGAVTLGDTNGSTFATLRTTNQGRTFSNAITVASGSSGAKTIEVAGSGQTFVFGGGLTLNDALNLNTYGASTDNLAVSGAISNGTSNGSVKVNGTSAAGIRGGIVALSGANTYSNGTTVQSGTLVVNNTSGSGTGSGSVGVASGATIGGTGTISGLLTLTQASVSPGSTVTFAGGATVNSTTNAGTLTASGGTVFTGNGSTLVYDVNTPNVSGGSGATTGNDLLSTTDLTIDQNLTLVVTGGVLFAPGTYHLIDYSGTLTDNSSGFSGWTAFGFPPAVYTFALGTDNGVNSIDINFTSVPEPTALSLFGMASLGLLIRRRRRATVAR